MKKYSLAMEYPIQWVPKWSFFRYKGRRWTRGAWLPGKQEYEIHTINGDRSTCIPNNTKVTLYWNRKQGRYADILDLD